MSDLSLAARVIRDGHVQVFARSGAEWLPNADMALVTLLALLSNAIWHEDTNHASVLPATIREAAEQLGAAIMQRESP